MAYSVSITGAAALQHRLKMVVGLLDDPTPLWEAIGFSMSENTRLRITNQVDVSGSSFIPSIRAQLQGGQTLLDRGLLRNSITYFANKNGVEWGVPSEIPYAWILNEGGTITPKSKAFLKFKLGGRWAQKRKVTIPKRQFLGVSISDKTEILDIISSFLTGH